MFQRRADTIGTVMIADGGRTIMQGLSTASGAGHKVAHLACVVPESVIKGERRQKGEMT